ncbi:uncharacterized protein [Palaemon carinicauda]|uniref:uncharacterized protein n=1 Tax=Palaemon carinicauda TaxID=392227 RepID=UPI0035B5EFCE
MWEHDDSDIENMCESKASFVVMWIILCKDSSSSSSSSATAAASSSTPTPIDAKGLGQEFNGKERRSSNAVSRTSFRIYILDAEAGTSVVLPPWVLAEDMAQRRSILTFGLLMALTILSAYAYPSAYPEAYPVAYAYPDAYAYAEAEPCGWGCGRRGGGFAGGGFIAGGFIGGYRRRGWYG